MPTTTFNLCVVQSGETNIRPQDIILPADDPPLNRNGRYQVKRLAKFLPVASYHFVYCSHLKRSVETAELLTKNLEYKPKIRQDIRLREQCVWGKPKNDRGVWRPLNQALDPLYNVPEETDAQTEDRLVKFLEKILFVKLLRKGPTTEQANVLLITHATVIYKLYGIFVKYSEDKDKFNLAPSDEGVHSTAVNEFQITFTHEEAAEDLRRGQGGDRGRDIPICSLTAVKCFKVNDISHFGRREDESSSEDEDKKKVLVLRKKKNRGPPPGAHHRHHHQHKKSSKGETSEKKAKARAASKEKDQKPSDEAPKKTSSSKKSCDLV